MDILYHGHSCVQISDGADSLIIDPFIAHNPLAKTKVEDIRVRYILLTHGHFDHIADAAAIAKQNGAKVVATFELANYIKWQGAETIEMNIGGSVDLGFAKATMHQAFHSSGAIVADKQQILYLGMPASFVVRMKDKTFFHAGDTGLFGDMKLIGERYNIDVAFLPIGDKFTMNPDDAVLAAQWLGAKFVVPIHYNTFPPIQQDGDAFVAKLKEKGIGGRALKPGESLEL